MDRRQRAVLGISGGVDSAVAAVLLLEAGYEVHALFMRNWDDDDGYCTAAADLQDARRVCEEIGIPLHTVNFAREYRERVFAHFLAELAAGRTPNPDVACNREIKFGVCFEHALRLGADWFATGHYARTAIETDGSARLLRAIDTGKDQSYFLHTVPGAMLARSLFPVGSLAKSEVRRIAHDHALPVHAKHDSTGICFIGERPFAEFLARHLPDRPGPIRTTEGREIGQHRGLAYYTLGQREGLGIGGIRGMDEAPWYVAAKDPATNVLVVTQKHDDALLMCRDFATEPAQWIAGAPPSATFECTARTRYRQPDQPVRVTMRGDGGCTVRAAVAQRAVTPGQSVVFYSGETCLGGAVIASAPTLEAAAADGPGKL